MKECWSRFLQAAVKTSAERYNWDLLNWEWHEGCEEKTIVPAFLY